MYILRIISGQAIISSIQNVMKPYIYFSLSNSSWNRYLLELNTIVQAVNTRLDEAYAHVPGRKRAKEEIDKKNTGQLNIINIY